MSHRNQTYLFALLTLILISIYASVWIPVLRNPEYPKGKDFTVFATAVKVIEEHGYQKVYDLDLQHLAQKEISPDLVNIGGGVLPFNHPPLLIPLFQLIVTPDLFQSYIRWITLNILLIAVCAWLSAKILKRAGWEHRESLFLIIPLLLIFPFQINLLQGQDIIFVLLGLLLFISSLQTDNLMLGGIGLALTTVSPHLTIIFAVPWFFSQRKRLYPFVFWGGLFATFSIFLVSISGAFEYIDVLSGSANAEGGTFGINKIRMYNFSSLALRFWRTMPIEILSAVTWAGYIFGIGFLCWLHHRFRSVRQHALLILAALTIMLGLFFSPHLHVHGLLFMWIAFLVWGKTSVEIYKWPTVTAGIILLLASLIMTPIFYEQVPLRSIPGFIVIFVTIYLLQKQLRDVSAQENSTVQSHTAVM